jgi:hypothetical protein
LCTQVAILIALARAKRKEYLEVVDSPTAFWDRPPQSDALYPAMFKARACH